MDKRTKAEMAEWLKTRTASEKRLLESLESFKIDGVEYTVFHDYKRNYHIKEAKQ